jgi:predicted nucleic acid-binding protein
MVIVDSSVWIDAFNQRITTETIWLQKALQRQSIGLTTFILCEVLRGLRTHAEFQRTEALLLGLSVFEAADTTTAIEAAQNFRHLQQRGITIRKTVDCLIATFCIRGGHELLHRDKDFKGFEDHLGLQVIHP